MNHATTHAKLTLVAAAWGLAWTAGRYVATDLSQHPITAAWLRYLIAVPVFLLWLHLEQGLQRPTGAKRRRVLAIGLCSTVLYQVFFMLGMRWTAAGDASLVITLNPLFTGLLAVVVLGQRLTPRLGRAFCSGCSAWACFSSRLRIPTSPQQNDGLAMDSSRLRRCRGPPQP